MEITLEDIEDDKKLKKFQLTVFDIQRLEDITSSVDDFELIDNVKTGTYAWMIINNKRIGLCPKREIPRNDVYSIRIKDDRNNEIHKMMEVADEVHDGKIPFFLIFRTLHSMENVKN